MGDGTAWAATKIDYSIQYVPLLEENDTTTRFNVTLTFQRDSYILYPPTNKPIHMGTVHATFSAHPLFTMSGSSVIIVVCFVYRLLISAIGCMHAGTHGYKTPINCYRLKAISIYSEL